MASLDNQTVESGDEANNSPSAVAQRWISEIDLAEKEQEEWLRRGKKIIERYKDERPNGKGGANAVVSNDRRFSILWSNIQTLGPAIYAQTPNAMVSRRFKDQDPLGRMASEILERAINYSCEEYDFDSLMIQVRDDYLLVGRGQAWIRYVPHMKPSRIGLEAMQTGEEGVQVSEDVQQYIGPDGEPVEDYLEDDEGPYIEGEELEYEEVVADHVVWTDYLHNPCRNVDELTWVCRKVYLTRDELIARFGEEVGKKVPLDYTPKNCPEKKEQAELFKKAQVYEIWDKATRKAYWISKGLSEQPLDERDDPLGLKDFFPCPKAMYATLGPDSLIPVPDYVLYQDQAEELDELTQRIGKLTDALRLVGFYAGEAKNELARVFTPGFENKLIPVDSWAQWAGSGGVKGLMEWVPIQDVVGALTACFEARQRIIDDIYQITGISDILRGDTNPNETATAQGIKAQWGSLRVRDRQRNLANFARDIIRIKGEIIAEKFSIETLQAMTNVQLFSSPEEKQALQQQMQMQQMMAQQTGQPAPPPDPQITRMMGFPTWSEIEELLRNDALRSFRIEIETDSTIEPDETTQKQQAIEYATMMGSLINAALPAVSAAPQLAPLIGETIKMVARRFRAGREMEDIIEQTFDAISQMPPAPPEGQAAEQPDPMQAEADALKANVDMAKVQQEGQRTQMEGQLGMIDAQLRAAELEVKRETLERDPTPQGIA